MSWKYVANEPNFGTGCIFNPENPKVFAIDLHPKVAMSQLLLTEHGHIMAAAPDLLEALRDAEDTLKGMIYNFEHETGENVDADINHTMEKIEQAIAKAKPKEN